MVNPTLIICPSAVVQIRYGLATSPIDINVSVLTIPAVNLDKVQTHGIGLPRRQGCERFGNLGPFSFDPVPTAYIAERAARCYSTARPTIELTIIKIRRGRSSLSTKSLRSVAP